MRRPGRLLPAILLCACFLSAGGPARAGADPMTELRQQMEALKREMEAQRRAYEARLQAIQERMDALAAQARPDDELEKALEAERASAAGGGVSGALSAAGRAVQSMNPDISVVVDTYYHTDDTGGGIEEFAGAAAGFGHVHGGDHGHAHMEEGFNMRHLELHLSGEVDPYFRAWAIAAVSEGDAEMEEAAVETTSLPAGLKVRAGKFFSDFGRINSQHSHEWDFVDQPLVYRLTLGDHGLNEKGVQASWLAPAPFFLLGGVEAFQGENERMFASLGGDHLPSRDGPRLWVGWLKLAPDLPGRHGLQAGIFGGSGAHQEAHDGNGDGEADHWLDGRSNFWGADLVYKYRSGREHGAGDVVIQGEYFQREKDLDVQGHFDAALVGLDRKDRQDGYYLQGVYGLFPRWRAGLRWEQVGLVNEAELPGSGTAGYDGTWRLSGMVDFSPTEFSRLRLQANRGRYAMEDGGGRDAWELLLQLMISLGTHGAHKF